MTTQTQNVNSPKLSTQSGFTLVEIMIAITLSLFLIAGMVKIYGVNKKSALVQSNLSRMQENQRSVVDFLNREIRMAGFYDQSQPTAIHPIAKFYDGSITGVSNPASSDGGGNASDTISIQYESPKDCLGNNTTIVDANNNTLAINTYYVLNQTLYCKASTNPIAQPIADDVVNMQILYGENTDPLKPNEIPTANHYVHAEDVGNMDNVVSVRIAMLFKTENPIKNQADTRTYTLLDADPIAYTNDKYRREIVTTTIALRN